MPRNPTKRERLTYIAAILRQLQNMAQDDDDRFLAYLIELAHAEAVDQLGRMGS